MKSYADIGETVTRLISEQFPSDAAFERMIGLPPKTVSNWRRGRSATYMKMLPALEAALGDDLSAYLHDTPASDGSLSKEEEKLLRAWRSAAPLSPDARRALCTTLVNMIKLSAGGGTK